MERVSLRVDEDALKKIDDAIEDGEFPNRSVAIRQAVDEVFVSSNHDQRGRRDEC